MNYRAEPTWMHDMTIPLAQCSCSSGNLLPLIVVGFAIWGLWRAAQWIGNWFANRRGPRKGACSNTARTTIIFFALMAVVLLALGGASALRSTPQVALAATDRPRLVFLGAGRCQPCQAMEPVREALRNKYANDLIIEYHDVWKDPEPGHRFGIRTIPTTIFVGPDGVELLRRQGYLSEEDIVNKWSEMGFALKKGGTDEKNK
ncbi:MAG: thioredoxin family protein [Kiritimatiellia bacterium]